MTPVTTRALAVALARFPLFVAAWLVLLVTGIVWLVVELAAGEDEPMFERGEYDGR